MARHDQGGIAASDILLAVGIGFVTGAAVGVAIGLLTAPKAGAALRQDLKARARDLKDAAAEQYKTAAEVASEWAEQTRDATERSRTAVVAGLREARKHAAVPRDPGETPLAGVEGLAEGL